MGFAEANRIAWKKLFVFEGRARRAEFWWFYLTLSILAGAVTFIGFLVLMFAAIGLVSEAERYGEPSGAAIAGLIIGYIVIFLVAIGIGILLLGAWARRLHDVGQSAHWLWLNLVGLSIVPLIMCIQEGQPFDNQYGPDPKAGERHSAAYMNSYQQAAGYAQPGAAQPAAHPQAGAPQPSTPPVPPPADPRIANDPFAAPPPPPPGV